MFELIPFDRRNHRVSVYDPFRAFDEMERAFFGSQQPGQSFGGMGGGFGGQTGGPGMGGSMPGRP